MSFNSLRLLFPSSSGISSFKACRTLTRLHKSLVSVTPSLVLPPSTKPSAIAFYHSPNYPKNPHYSSVNNEDVATLENFLAEPESQIMTDFDDVKHFMTDWTNTYQAISIQNPQDTHTPIVIFPHTAHEVSNILQYCNEKQIAVVPQSGKSGLVGGSVPVFDEIVVNLSKMDKVLDFDESSGILLCQAGCNVQKLNEYLATFSPQFMLPYDLGSKGICRIGGNLGTNAGGLLMGRYGSLNGNVLGVEVVLADGHIVNTLSHHKKDNTGMKLHQMFIGSEGTLGIVTCVSIQCVYRPVSVQTCMLRLKSFENVLEVMINAKEALCDILGKVEYLDQASYQSCIYGLPYAQDVFNRKKEEILDGMEVKSHPTHTNHYLIIETHGYEHENDLQRLRQVIENFMDLGLIEDGVYAQNETQRDNMWAFREEAPMATTKIGNTLFFDFTLPFNNDMYKVVDYARSIADSDDIFINGFGHLGEGNIHVAITFKNTSAYKAYIDTLQSKLYKYIEEIGGSISSECGIGTEKMQYIGNFKTPEYLQLMSGLKKTMDPNLILNPYKLFWKSQEY